MRYALVNPPWSFEGSIYFGCPEPHLPLEYGYAQALLERAGHEAVVIDGQLEAVNLEEIERRVRDFGPDFTVITTAPSYLFWRCAPPELRVPQLTANALRGQGRLIIVGPHGSTTPRSTLKKLGADAVILGECEEVLPRLAGDWANIPGLCCEREGEPVVQGGPQAADVNTLPPLRWPSEMIARHTHHHHRFDAPPAGLGAEMETSRGCPYHCTFCAKDNFRDKYRRRPLAAIFEELDGLLAQGVEYVYFIDEIFLPNRDLLLGLGDRKIKIGVQTRIDLWNHEMIELLGRAGCVSIEAGVESITEEGRDVLEKKCKLTTVELASRLIFAKERVPFVQANLLDMQEDNEEEVERWRQHLLANGVWANKPVPLFPYPGSPEYRRKWGPETEDAWERAHNFYLSGFAEFSDIQEERPLPLVRLEVASHAG